MEHPWVMIFATSTFAPGSTLGRFVAEWQAHSIHVFATTFAQDALRTVFSREQALKWGSDLFYVLLAGAGGVFYANKSRYH